MHEPDTRHEWVSVKQAAIHFGTSESDIRRRIKRGELISESLARPGGTLLRVRLDAPDTHQPIESPPAPEARQRDPEALQEIASGLLDRTERLDATMAAKDAEIARLNARVAELEREAGRSEIMAAELERLRRPWWRRLLDS